MIGGEKRRVRGSDLLGLAAFAGDLIIGMCHMLAFRIGRSGTSARPSVSGENVRGRAGFRPPRRAGFRR
ncbi:hypothetical protein D3C76_1828650 [compost metagenome]